MISPGSSSPPDPRSHTVIPGQGSDAITRTGQNAQAGVARRTAGMLCDEIGGDTPPELVSSASAGMLLRLWVNLPTGRDQHPQIGSDQELIADRAVV